MKKRVCCFCETWESGGIESFLHNTLSGMNHCELEIDIVSVKIKKSIFTESMKSLGINFIELSGKQHRLVKNHAMFQRLLVERQYDVVHLNAFQGMQLYYLKLAQRANVPVRIAHSHNNELRKSKTRKLKLLLHNSAKMRYTKFATDLWACSKSAAEFLFSKKEIAERGYSFISNGIETERFRFNKGLRESIRKSLNVHNCLLIGNVGRLCYQKNQSFLIDTFAEVEKQHPNSRLILIGEGEDLPMLIAKTASLNLSDKIIFYGTTSHIEYLFWAMDVFAFPSLFEGLGIAAIEAQAAGLPVVASNFVPPEAKASSNYHSAPLNVKNWAKVLLNIDTERNSNAIDEVIFSGYEINTVSNRIEHAYLFGGTFA